MQCLFEKDFDPRDKEDVSLTIQIISGARLGSRLVSKPGQPALQSYHNIRFWGEAAIPRSSHSSAEPSYFHTHLYQLQCRLLNRLVLIMNAHQDNLWLPSLQPAYVDEIERFTMDTCMQFINTSYDSSDYANIRSSSLDATDLFCAGVVYTYLSRKRSDELAASPSPEAKDVLQKCSVLVAFSGGGRFSAMQVYQKILMKLSSARETGGCSRPVEDLAALQRSVPSSLYQLVELCF